MGRAGTGIQTMTKNALDMKLLIIIPALGVLLAAFSSCAVPYQPEEPKVFFQEEDSLVTVIFSASGSERSKVTGVSEEAERVVDRWAVFAFDNRSGQFRYENASSGGPLPMKLSAGRSYTCYAIVNYPETGPGAFDPASVRSTTDLTGKVAYLGDCRGTALPMFGSEEVTPVADSDTEVTITVKRLVSRVDLRGLKVDFSGKPHLESKTFTLRAIYLTNTYRTTRYGEDYTFPELSSTRSAWYNTGGWHRGEAAEAGIDVIVGDRSIDTVISAGSPYSREHSFYAFPNPTPASEDITQTESWTRRCTRLVIEATIDDDTVYYAIKVPSMTRNRIFAASSVVIHGRGSNDPEIIDIDPDIIEVTVQPVIDDDWDGAGDIYLD